MNRKILILALLFFASTLLLLPNLALAQGQGKPAGNALAIPVTGAFTPSTTSGTLTSLGAGNFAGTLNVQQFVNQNGVLNAVGTLVGTLTNAAGQTSSVVISNVTAPVTNASGSCSVLSLTLGPLHLDLLGLVVNLNQVNLNITAQSGSGNLLGNLLCGVANALNTGGPLGSLSTTLNQLLGALGL